MARSAGCGAGGWGERSFLEKLAQEWAPEAADEDDFREWFVWHMRRSLSPGAALTAYRAAMEIDVGDILSPVRVPALLLPRPSQPGPEMVVPVVVDAGRLAWTLRPERFDAYRHGHCLQQPPAA